MGVAGSPFCSRNARPEKGLVRRAQSRGASVTPMKKGMDNWNSLAQRPQWMAQPDQTSQIDQIDQPLASRSLAEFTHTDEFRFKHET